MSRLASNFSADRCFNLISLDHSVTEGSMGDLKILIDSTREDLEEVTGH